MNKAFSKWILMASLILPGVLWAQQEPRYEIENIAEVIQQRIDPALVQPSLDAEKIQIRLSNGQVYEIPAYPEVETMKAALGLKMSDKVKEAILKKGGQVPEEVNPLEDFEALSKENQQKFLEIRKDFLANAARILSSVKFVAGVGSLVGDSFSFVKVQVKKIRGQEVEGKKNKPTSFQDRSNRAIQAILQGIDYKLWTQAPLVIDSNEFGLTLSAGIIAEMGARSKGMGGVQELGFTLAYNKASRAFVFEIFHNSERFKSSAAAMSVLGVAAKAEMMISRRQGATDVIKGNSFYPPAVPGNSMTSPDFFSAGFSSGLGLPPPPLADLLTYTNNFERTSLIRITVSPLVKGFVRVHIGDLRASARLVVMPVVDLVKTISDKVVRYAGRNSCSVIFQ